MCRVFFVARVFFFRRDDAVADVPLLSAPFLSTPRRSLEGNAALNGEKTSALAEEFKITPREVLAVVEHFKMSDGVRVDAVAVSYTHLTLPTIYSV